MKCLSGENYTFARATFLHGDFFALSHFCTRGHFERTLFCTSVTLARGDTITQRHFCKEGHYCTATILHEGLLLHEGIFLQDDTFTRRITFSWRKLLQESKKKLKDKIKLFLKDSSQAQIKNFI